MARASFGHAVWHSHFLAIAGAASLLLLSVSVIAVPWVLVRLPPDYFSRSHSRLDSPLARHRPFLFAVISLGKNIAGLLLLLAGIAMLFLPGQGILTILVALFVLDFPGKRRFERRLVGSPRVLRAVNALRRRAGRPELKIDSER